VRWSHAAMPALDQGLREAQSVKHICDLWRHEYIETRVDTCCWWTGRLGRLAVLHCVTADCG